MSKKDYSQLWVDPAFKRKFKTAASIEGMSITDFSRELAKDSEDLREQFKKLQEKNSEKKKSFGFGF